MYRIEPCPTMLYWSKFLDITQPHQAKSDREFKHLWWSSRSIRHWIWVSQTIKIFWIFIFGIKVSVQVYPQKCNALFWNVSLFLWGNNIATRHHVPNSVTHVPCSAAVAPVRESTESKVLLLLLLLLPVEKVYYKAFSTYLLEKINQILKIMGAL